MLRRVAVVLAVLTAMLSPAVAHADHAELAPACPLTEGIVVDIGANTHHRVVVMPVDERTIGPIAAEVPAGVYDVTLASWDHHLEKPDQVQPHEQWFLEGLLGGATVFTSNSTADLPDDQAWLIQTVNFGVELAAGLDAVIAEHGWVADGSGPNSVVPICAAFVPLAAPAADVGVTKTDSADPVTVGDQFDYTITVTNYGPDPAGSVVVTDELPAEVSYVSGPAGCVYSAGVVTCSVGSLEPGTSADIQFTVLAVAAADPPAVNRATVTAAEEDGNPDNNVAEEPTTIVAPVAGQIDVAITIVDLEDPIDLGADIVYEIVVTNVGPLDATEVTVVQALPVGPSFVSCEPTTGTDVYSNGFIDWVIGDLAVGDSASAIVHILPHEVGSYLSEVEVVAAEEDSNPSNNQDDEVTGVAAVLSVTPTTAAVVVTPTTAAVIVQPAVLAVTGVESSLLAALGLLLLVIGSGALLIGRRSLKH